MPCPMCDFFQELGSQSFRRYFGVFFIFFEQEVPKMNLKIQKSGSGRKFIIENGFRSAAGVP